MPFLTFTIRVESDLGGQPNVVFEKIKRVSLTQEQNINVQKAGGDGAGVYSALPSIEQSATLNALVLSVDNPLLIKLASVAPGDGIISLKAGGVLVVLDGSLAAGIASNVLVNNVPATACTIAGVAGGT